MKTLALVLASLFCLVALPVLGTSGRDCPSDRPIKGNFTTYDGSRCIAHSPGGRWYAKTRAEKCYATMADAVADGCRPSKR